MSRPRPEWIVLAVALVTTIVVALAAGGPPDEQLDTYSASDYRSGGYAAWRELLLREGVRAAAFDRRPTELDRRIDTLVVAYPPPAPQWVPRTAAEDAALVDWVRAGGRAIVLGAGTPDLEGERSPLKVPALAPRLGGGELRGPFAPEVARLEGSGRLRYTGRDDALLADEGGALVIRRRLGAGTVAFVAAPELFTNRNLGRADNARLAYLLARPRRAGGVVAFDEAIHGTVVDRTWWEVLALPDRIALVGALFAGALLLVGGALRLAPPVPMTPPREPTSVEYLDALAALYARAHLREHALEVLFASLPPTARDSPAATQFSETTAGGFVGDARLVAGARLAHTLREEHHDGRLRDGGRATHPLRPRPRHRRQ
jgi:hypothetical protein